MGLLIIQVRGSSLLSFAVFVLLASGLCGCGKKALSSESSGGRPSTRTSSNASGDMLAMENISVSSDASLPQSNSSERVQLGSREQQGDSQQSAAGLEDTEQKMSVDAGTRIVRDEDAAVVLLPDDITVWIAGDSTVSNGSTPCPRGWGGEFQPLFDSRVRVVNSAAGGRSVRTWLYDVGDDFDESGECELGRDASGQLLLQDRWSATLAGMGPGDYLLIQFGINDGDPSCNRHVGLDAFIESYAMMAEAAQQRGTQPVFITPASMIRCNGSVAVGSRGAFVPATIEVGAQLGVPVIDLHALSVELYNQLEFCPVAGGDVSANTTGAVGDFFCDDHTHFDRSGAERVAELMGGAIAGSGMSLAEYLR